MNDYLGDDNINWSNEARMQNKNKNNYTDVKYLEPYVPYIKGKTIVDCGSNIGKWCQVFQKAGVKEYKGIDASSHAVQMARERNPDVFFTRMNLVDLPCNFKADIFFFHTVLQHINLENKKKILPRLHCALNDPGYLIIEEKQDVETPTTFTYKGWIDFIEPFGFKCLWQSIEEDTRCGYIFEKVLK